MQGGVPYEPFAAGFYLGDPILRSLVSVNVTIARLATDLALPYWTYCQLVGQ